MKIAISCDEYCAQVGNDFYLRDFGVILVKRYLMVFEKVRLIVRTFQSNNIMECGKYKNLIDDDRIEVFPIPFFQGPKQFIRQFPNIKRLVMDALIGCDLAILRLPSAIGFSVWKQAKKDNIPYAVELVYDCKDGYKQAFGIRKFLWWRMHNMQKAACKSAIGMAPVTSNYLQVHYTPNKSSIVTSHYSSVEIDDNFFFHPRYYPNKRSLTLIHVANQVEFMGRKGHEDVIKSIKLLKERGLDVNVVFIGEDYNNGIHKLQNYAESIGVKQNIIFTGFLSSQEMRESLLHGDIAILPTRAEGLPRVIIEAMAVGLPCITTNVSGNSELIENDFLFNYGDVNEISRLIEILIRNQDMYEQQSKLNFEKSLEYSKKKLDNRRRKFYLELRNIIEHK